MANHDPTPLLDEQGREIYIPMPTTQRKRGAHRSERGLDRHEIHALREAAHAARIAAGKKGRKNADR